MLIVSLWKRLFTQKIQFKFRVQMRMTIIWLNGGCNKGNTLFSGIRITGVEFSCGDECELRRRADK